MCGSVQPCRGAEGKTQGVSLPELMHMDFPGSPVVKNPPASARDKGLIPGPGRSHMLRTH